MEDRREWCMIRYRDDILTPIFCKYHIIPRQVASYEAYELSTYTCSCVVKVANMMVLKGSLSNFQPFYFSPRLKYTAIN